VPVCGLFYPAATAEPPAAFESTLSRSTYQRLGENATMGIKQRRQPPSFT